MNTLPINISAIIILIVIAILVPAILFKGSRALRSKFIRTVAVIGWLNLIFLNLYSYFILKLQGQASLIYLILTVSIGLIAICFIIRNTNE